MAALVKYLINERISVWKYVLSMFKVNEEDCRVQHGLYELLWYVHCNCIWPGFFACLLPLSPLVFDINFIDFWEGFTLSSVVSDLRSKNSVPNYVRKTRNELGVSLRVIFSGKLSVKSRTNSLGGGPKWVLPSPFWLSSTPILFLID